MRTLLHQPETSGIAGMVDPRIRMTAALVLLLLVISSATTTFPLCVTALCLPAALAHGMKPRTLLLRMLHPLFIATIVVVLRALWGQGEPILTAGIVSIYPAGLQAGLLIASRIIASVSIVILLSRIQTFTEGMAALAWLRVPHGLIEVSLFAWRSIFLLYDDASVVYTAQKNRLGYCGIRRGLHSLGSMAGMLAIKAFDNSHSVTIAMTQRGYDGTLPLSNRSPLPITQLTGLLLFVVFAAITWKLQN